MLKKIISLLMVSCMVSVLTACSSEEEVVLDTEEEVIQEEIQEPEVPEEEVPIEEEPIEEVDEDAPEYINMNSIKDTSNVSLYSSSRIDSVAHDFRVFDFKLPNELEVSKAYELHDSEEPRSTGVLVPEFLEGNDEHYSYFELDGRLSGCAMETKHRIALSVDKGDPVAKEVLEAEYENVIVEAIAKEGFDGFVLYPDTTKVESGFASVMIFLNLGSYEHAYGSDYFVGRIQYEGGFMDYADVDVEEVVDTLLSLVDADVFEEVK